MSYVPYPVFFGARARDLPTRVVLLVGANLASFLLACLKLALSKAADDECRVFFSRNWARTHSTLTVPTWLSRSESSLSFSLETSRGNENKSSFTLTPSSAPLTSLVS